MLLFFNLFNCCMKRRVSTWCTSELHLPDCCCSLSSKLTSTTELLCYFTCFFWSYLITLLVSERCFAEFCIYLKWSLNVTLFILNFLFWLLYLEWVKVGFCFFFCSFYIGSLPSGLVSSVSIILEGHCCGLLHALFLCRSFWQLWRKEALMHFLCKNCTWVSE